MTPIADHQLDLSPCDTVWSKPYFILIPIPGGPSLASPGDRKRDERDEGGDVCILAGPAPSLQLKCRKSGTAEGLRGNRSWPETAGPQGVLSRRGVHCREHTGGGVCCSAHAQGPYPARKGSLPAALQPSYPRVRGHLPDPHRDLCDCFFPKTLLCPALKTGAVQPLPFPSMVP